MVHEGTMEVSKERGYQQSYRLSSMPMNHSNDRHDMVILRYSNITHTLAGAMNSSLIGHKTCSARGKPSLVLEAKTTTET